MKGKKKVRKAIRLSPYLNEAIDYTSDKMTMNKTAIILLALNEYFDAHLTDQERSAIRKKVDQAK